MIRKYETLRNNATPVYKLQKKAGTCKFCEELILVKKFRDDHFSDYSIWFLEENEQILNATIRDLRRQMEELRKDFFLLQSEYAELKQKRIELTDIFRALNLWRVEDRYEEQIADEDLDIAVEEVDSGYESDD